MQLLKIKPVLYEYETFEEFIHDMSISQDDLILSNAPILGDRLSENGCLAHVLYQEDYGRGEPNDVMVNKMIETIHSFDFNRIIAIGGGTILDIAKILSVCDDATDVNDLYDTPLVSHHELIAIPTTCGTGSEVTNIAVVNRTKLHTKQGLVGEAMYPDRAVLVSEFISDLPYKVFATSSIDALIHAIESYLSPKASKYTRFYAEMAMTSIIMIYKSVAKDPDAYKQFGEMLFEASLNAGISFSNAGCGLVHAMSYAFGGKYHVAHGESNYQFLMNVLRFYDLKDPDGFKDLKTLLKGIFETEEDPLESLTSLLEEILPYKPMHEYGATEEDLRPFAKSTYDNQQRLLANAFVPVDEEDIYDLYKDCL
jgi:4-hydroxybutyrate dehydrogenase